MKSIVHITENAFISMRNYAVLKYKKETLNHLYGEIKKEHINGNKKRIYHVQYSVEPIVESLFSGVNLRDSDRNGWLDNLMEDTGVEPIGDFHSHSDYRDLIAVTKPSEGDVSNSELGLVYIIMTLNKKSRRRKWKLDKKREWLRGTFRKSEFDYLAFKLIAYVINGKGEDKKPELVKLRFDQSFYPRNLGFYAKHLRS